LKHNEKLIPKKIKFMKKSIIPFGLGLLLTIGALLPQKSYSQDVKKKPTATVKDSIVPAKKEEKNRNVMLNADSNSGPRAVNIGLPFQDMLILQNGVPVTNGYYPQTPISNWRYDATMGSIGVISFAENALTNGRIGFAVSSADRDPATKFKGFFQAYTNSFGSLVYSGLVTGPVGKKGWGYTVGLSETYDHGNGVNRMYTPWNDRCEIVKLGISKKYKNGLVRILYKHAEQNTQYSNYWPLQFKGNGEFTNIPGFTAGVDSYVLADGKVPYFDALTGTSSILNLGDSKNTTKSDAVYLTGNHDFKSGWKLDYTSMYMHTTAPFSIQYPISLGVADPDQQAAKGQSFKLHNQSTAYVGSAQIVSNLYKSPTTTNSSFSRAELKKKIGSHALRFGFTDIFYENLGEQTNYGVYYQTVEPNPRLLDYYQYVPAYNMSVKASNADGLLPVKNGEYFRLKTNKAALYFSDDFRVKPWLALGVGARIENQSDTETHDQYVNDFVLGRELITNDFKNRWNHAAVANFVANVTKDFGFVGDVTYNDFNNRYYTYGQETPKRLTSVVNENQIHVTNFGGGLFFNMGDKFQITSKVGSIKKDNYTTSLDVYNPANPTQKTTVYPVSYDIKTFGWTTDMVVSPFKNFTLHALLTIQKPQFENYTVDAFGQTFNYSSNNVPGISKTLVELDPSYQVTPDFRVWVSLRYFGKQFGNLTNSFDYKPWIENFGGVDYRLSRKVEFKLQVVNFLDQSGIKGALQGADQIKDSSPFIGRTIVAQAMRPRTIEFTAIFKL
jgi:hypothetical protein